jgi:ribosomal protein S18 acetylase RimI-like enzyme
MNHLLNNPVFNALCSGDRELALGTDKVKFFPEKVSPFAGFPENYENGFSDLYNLLPAGRTILYATPGTIPVPAGWQLQHEINGLQFVYESTKEIIKECKGVQPLRDIHIDQMRELAALTKPGPFGLETIRFGSYYGIFNNDKLVAMTGQRLHVQNATEISAVCTHPEHTGKGYAFTLLQHQLQIILQQKKIPFLHVRAGNERAITLYEKNGFTVSRQMNFYFMKRK